MELINEAVASYQEKIGACDKQLWEKSVEQRVLGGFHNVPKKTGRVKSELIDVDLVRGSTFTKAKPTHGWFQVTLRGLVKVVFLPLYIQWWQQQTSDRIGMGLLFLYAMQAFTLSVYYTSDASFEEVEIRYPETSKQAERKWLQSLSVAHLCIPICLMVVLGIAHAHIVSSSESNKQRRTDTDRSRPGKSKKSSGSKNESSHKHTGTVSQDSEKNGDNKSDASTSLTGSTCRRRHVSHNSAAAANATVTRGQCLLNATEWRKTNSGCLSEPNLLLNDVYIEGSTGTVGSTELPPGVTSCDSSIKNHVGAKYVGNCGYKEKREKYDCYYVTCDEMGSEDAILTGNALEDDSMLDTAITVVTGEIILPNETGTQQMCESITPTLEELSANSSEAFKSHDLHTLGDFEMGCDSGTTVNSDDLCGTPENPVRNVAQTAGMAPPMDTPELQKTLDNGKYVEDGIMGPCEVGNTDLLIGSESEGFSVSTSGETECQPEVCGNHVESCATNGPTIFVKQPSSGADDSSSKRSEEQELYDASKQTQAAGLQQGRRRVCKTAYQRSQETLTQGVRLHPKLEVKLFGAKDNLGVSSAESDGDPVSPDSPSPRVMSSELDWDDTMHSEVGCSSDTSSNATPESDISERNSVIDEEQDLVNVQHASSVMKNLASSTDKVSCMIWEGEDVKKIDLTVLDLGWTIIERVNKIPEVCDYLMLAVVMVIMSMSLPVIFRVYHMRLHLAQLNYWSLPDVLRAVAILFGSNWRQTVIIVNGVIQRMCFSFLFYFLLSVAERTFKQRFLYAKYFAYLTSCRRAKKSELPHFRLNKVRNIKTWLSLRSFLKKRGPQRSVDTIVSFAFLVSVMLVSYMCVELLQDSGTFLEHLSNWELMLWCLALGLYVLRFMTLGTKINKKYRNFSVLITEQINLYLHMEQKPHKKEELMLANNVLKLAEALLKELESPFKISGLSANPYLYNITKVVILSAFSAVLTELLGFKLKLYKIKLRG